MFQFCLHEVRGPNPIKSNKLLKRRVLHWASHIDNICKESAGLICIKRLPHLHLYTLIASNFDASLNDKSSLFIIFMFLTVVYWKNCPCWSYNYLIYSSRKYERSKTVIEGMKANEDSLKKSLTEYDDAIKTSNAKYESLKNHAIKQLET